MYMSQKNYVGLHFDIVGVGPLDGVCRIFFAVYSWFAVLLGGYWSLLNVWGVEAFLGGL